VRGEARVRARAAQPPAILSPSAQNLRALTPLAVLMREFGKVFATLIDRRRSRH
jgi:hypothetical protein